MHVVLTHWKACFACMQGDEQQLAAAEQVKELQAELSAQAKSHQQAQEALAIEEKCKRDQLQVTSTTLLTLSAGVCTHAMATAYPN